MSLSNYLENKVLDKVFSATDFTVTNAYMSLHTAAPGETGADEVTGGSYARQLTAFNAGSGGTADNSANEEFTSMPTATVVAVGFWDAVSAGNFLWGDWLGNNAWVPFIADNPAADTITSPNHALSVDDRVAFSAEFGGTLPTGVVDTTLYWVVSSAADTFTVSTASGGATLNLTTDGDGMYRAVTTKTVNSGDTFRVAAGDADVVIA